MEARALDANGRAAIGANARGLRTQTLQRVEQGLEGALSHGLVSVEFVDAPAEGHDGCEKACGGSGVTDEYGGSIDGDPTAAARHVEAPHSLVRDDADPERLEAARHVHCVVAEERAVEHRGPLRKSRQDERAVRVALRPRRANAALDGPILDLNRKEVG